MNIGVHISFRIRVFSGYMPRSGIAGSYGISIFSFLRNFSGSDGKGSSCNAGDPGLILGLGRSPGEGNGNPSQYFCLENSMDREAWWPTVHRVAKSWIRLRD